MTGKQILCTVIVVILILALLYFLRPSAEKQTNIPITEYLHADEEEEAKTVEPNTESTTSENVIATSKESASARVNIISQPIGNSENQIVKHSSYTLAYAEEFEQAEWVYYLLTRKMTRGNAKRTNKFVADPYVTTGSAVTADYSGSGYDRGHLCPSADVRHDAAAQQETFYMSNMSPQAPQFNRGIWKKLEEQVRQWVEAHDSIYVATGPVLKKNLKQIGKKNKVAVPEHYYKILYSPNDGGHMLAFLLANTGSSHEVEAFIVPTDSVEKLTGIDFFPQILNEEKLESRCGTTAWWN